MSNYLFITKDPISEVLVPLKPIDHTLDAKQDKLIYVPLASRVNAGVVRIGEGLNIDNGLLSFDRRELDVKLSTNVGSENAGKFLYVSDNGNITFVDQVQTITKVSELENDVGYITNDTTSLVNYYDSLKVDQLFTDAITEAENAKAIAMGKSDSKVFDTYIDMLTWLGDENNKGQLIVGSNLFIIADNEPDYWVTEVFDDFPTYIGPYPSYYGILPLESKLPDISNMVTTDTIQTISESKTFNKYITFNEDIRTSRIYTTTLKNLISVSDNNLRIGALDGNNNLVLQSWNRPTIQIINNTPEDIAFVSEIPTKVSELENDSEFLTKSDVVDSVYNTDTNLPLSANQGKLLNEKLGDKADKDNVMTLDGSEVVSGIKVFTETIGLLNTDGTMDRIRHINNNFLIVDQNGAALLDIDEGFQTISSFGKKLAFEEDIPEIQDVPTKTSQLENDSGFITSDDIPEIDTSNLVTLTSNQTISGQKTFDDLVFIKYGLADTEGNLIVSSSDGGLQVGGGTNKISLISSERPDVTDYTHSQPAQQMAYLSDIPTLEQIKEAILTNTIGGGLEIATMNFDSMTASNVGQWYIQFKNGLTIILGRTDVADTLLEMTLQIPNPLTKGGVAVAISNARTNVACGLKNTTTIQLRTSSTTSYRMSWIVIGI